MSFAPLAALIGAGACVIASPYLSRLTRSVPDREQTDWWRGAAATTRRTGVTAGIGLVLGALAGASAGWTAVLPAFVLLALGTTPLLIVDYEQHRLPNRLVRLLAAGAAVLFTVAAASTSTWHPWLRALEGAAAVFAVLFLLAYLAPSGFGFGDVKLGGVLGGYLGWFGWAEVYYGIFAGFVLGALVALALLVSRRGTMKTAIPFGPTLVLGPLLVLAVDAVRIAPT